ncbi:MAG: nitrite reductase/ring-hydroxylating ferredoxin subunit [Desulforhopalus sp.]|jgi:nitrite reductase/ring-hydroxylating ferredoxin subunit
MMNFIKIAKIIDFEHKHIKSYSVMGKKIGVVREDNGDFFAIEVGCKHQSADLTKGPINGMVVTCPRHQWMYDLSTGKCLNHESVDLRRHAMKIEDGNIFISLSPIE